MGLVPTIFERRHESPARVALLRQQKSSTQRQDHSSLNERREDHWWFPLLPRGNFEERVAPQLHSECILIQALGCGREAPSGIHRYSPSERSLSYRHTDQSGTIGGNKAHILVSLHHSALSFHDMFRMPVRSCDDEAYLACFLQYCFWQT